MIKSVDSQKYKFGLAPQGYQDRYADTHFLAGLMTGGTLARLSAT